MRIDGNALRAARREALGEPIEYTLGEATVTFPVEMPLTIVTDIQPKALEEDWPDEKYLPAILSEMLGDEQWQRLWTQRPSLLDLRDLWRLLLDAYGVSQGESTSSPASSATGGESSKPKSGGSTKRTRGRTSSRAASVA